MARSFAYAASLRQSSASVRFSASSSGEKAAATRSACSGNRRCDELLAAVGDRDRGGAAVVLEPVAADQPAALERVDDLRRVGLGGVQAAAQGAQLELAARRDEHDQDGEAGGGQALPLEVAAEPAAHGRLGAQQPVERAVRQRVVHDEPHRGAIVWTAPDGAREANTLRRHDARPHRRRRRPRAAGRRPRARGLPDARRGQDPGRQPALGELHARGGDRGRQRHRPRPRGDRAVRVVARARDPAGHARRRDLPRGSATSGPGCSASRPARS